MNQGINETLIVGAGIIGCACAAALAAQGLQVTLIEAELPGGGATAAGMGHLVVMDDSPAELALTAYSLELWRAFVTIQPTRAAEHEYRRCGTIWIGADAEDMAIAQTKHNTLAEHGVACEMLSAHTLQQLEPALRQGLAGGLLVPDDALVYPFKSAQILLDQAQKDGARLLRGTVTSLVAGGVRLADGSELMAERIVIANGIAAASLLSELPLRYKKGQLLITDRYPDLIRHQLVELGYLKSAHASDGDSVAFNVQPRPTGQVFIGSSRQFDVTDKVVDHSMLAKMLQHACEFMPALGTLKALRSWSGFRAASPDGLPLIGAHPWRPGVWLATGHEGLGITTALATAELLKDQICGQRSKIASAPYLPSRFQLHQPVPHE